MNDIYEIKREIKCGAFSDIFLNIMGYTDPQIAAMRVLNVLDRFSRIFPNENCALFSAPGRAELGGNHTDHQHGHILAAGINADMLCVAAVTDNGKIIIESEGFGNICVDLKIKHPLDKERGTAAGLIRGIAMWFEERGYRISGVNAFMISDVPPGSGMSSSAAFEMLWGTVFNSFFADNFFSKIDIAKAGLYAENVYFGKPCGLMDQTACAYGGIISVDFADADEPQILPINYDFADEGYALCIINAGDSHDDLTDDYSEITNEMYSVANALGKKYLSELTFDTVFDNAAFVRNKCGDRAYLRAVNYFEEDWRATEMAKALQKNDFDKYLKLVEASGKGSYMYLQNIYSPRNTKNQAIAVALHTAEISLKGSGAFRVHGGGFAGTIQAYVPFEKLDTFIANMEKALFSGCCRVLKIRNSGAMKITLNEV